NQYFKKGDGGWIAPGLWPFSRQKNYLLNDQQKANVAAFYRKSSGAGGGYVFGFGLLVCMVLLPAVVPPPFTDPLVFIPLLICSFLVFGGIRYFTKLRPLMEDATPTDQPFYKYSETIRMGVRSISYPAMTLFALISAGCFANSMHDLWIKALE